MKKVMNIETILGIHEVIDDGIDHGIRHGQPVEDEIDVHHGRGFGYLKGNERSHETC